MSDDKRLERMENKIDKITEDIGDINSTLSAQHISLKEHIRRTALLEAELKPIKRHVDMVSGAIKLIVLIAAVTGILEAIKLFK